MTTDTTCHHFVMLFQKLPPLTYIGHRDFLSLIERLIRKSQLPIVYKNKQKPVMKFDVIQPLPLGVIGYHEILHFSLREALSPKDILQRLTPHPVEGFVIIKIVPCRVPSKWFHRHKHSIIYDLDYHSAEPVDKQAFLISNTAASCDITHDRIRLCVDNTSEKPSNLKEIMFSLPDNLDIITTKRIKLLFK